MPGVHHLSVDERLDAVLEQAEALGIGAVILFGLPRQKDEIGSENFAPDGIVQRAVRRVREQAPGMAVFTDVCCCGYTTHGHCGVVRNGDVDNDLTLEVLGRVATTAARLLQGKHKPAYTPFLDTGDHVIIVNAARVRLTGRKDEQKVYRQHSGYEGGLREERAKIVRARRPNRLVEEAVRGMLPKTKLGDAMYRKLKVYAEADHPHAAQKPSHYEVA